MRRPLFAAALFLTAAVWIWLAAGDGGKKTDMIENYWRGRVMNEKKKRSYKKHKASILPL